MNEISTKLVNIDYETLIQNYKKEELWKKIWTIYDFGNLKVDVSLQTINVCKMTLTLQIDVYYKGDKKHRYRSIVRSQSTNIPIRHDEYSDTHFKRRIYGIAQSTITSSEFPWYTAIEDMLIEEFAVYKQEKIRIADIERELEEIANEFLDKNNVSNEDIRGAYISNFVENHPDLTNNLRRIKKQFCERVLTKELLLWASFNQNEKDVEYYSHLLNQKKVSKSCINVWLQKQKDQEIDWADCLEKI